MLTLLLSDVPGDNPIDIASGPTTADPTTCEQALDIVRRYGIELPPAVHEVLARAGANRPSPAMRGSRAPRAA